MIRSSVTCLFMPAQPVFQYRFLQEMRGLPEVF